MAKKSRRKKMINIPGHRLMRLTSESFSKDRRRLQYSFRCECGATHSVNKPDVYDNAQDARYDHYIHAAHASMGLE